MIRNDDELEIARKNLRQLEEVLRVARTVHPPDEYPPMSRPILLEIQQRHQEIVEYLMSCAAEAPSVS